MNEQAPMCNHGAMKLRSGEKDGKPWSGYFCSLPKEQKQDQCSPVWNTQKKDSQPVQGDKLDKILVELSFLRNGQERIVGMLARPISARDATHPPLDEYPTEQEEGISHEDRPF